MSLGGATRPTTPIVYTSATDDFTVTPVPVDVAVTGSQTYGGSPTFSGSTASPPTGITVSTASVNCTELAPFTFINAALPVGSRTLLPQSCSGATLSGTEAGNYAASYTSATDDFTVVPGAADRDRFEPLHELRQRPAGHHTRVQRPPER